VLAPVLQQAARAALSVVGLYDRSLPATYDEGVLVPPLPPLAPLAPPAPLSTQALDEAAADALRVQPVDEVDYLGGLVSGELSHAAVEAVLDELVRPALNADGGDIRLVDIRDGDIYVKLVGACGTCPSSVMTMRMGVERLLQEEFPDMGELIQVDGEL
jgi:Fe-S cluster biogenesis protein NfuA